MEPAIPTGSLVYVKYIQPEEIQTEDVIAFYGTDADGSIVTHRVVSNSAAMGNFITKGDANSDNDMNPIPYANYIGKVQLSAEAGRHLPDDHRYKRQDCSGFHDRVGHRAGDTGGGAAG